LPTVKLQDEKYNILNIIFKNIIYKVKKKKTKSEASSTLFSLMIDLRVTCTHDTSVISHVA